jgi:NAD-dependent dihydropyrimidine dehydrogenase PreA subunit
MATNPPKIDTELCIGCAACVAVCPNGVLEMVDDKSKVVHPEKCQACYTCVEMCPVQAITKPK